jgi:glucosamine--fructose-6-phosphate aminotransferase (isomerizing)
MCGIVGYIGSSESTHILLSGLQELEYRGYDSAGISVLQANGVQTFKAVGKLQNLVNKVGGFRTVGPVAGIGHTRWATHGKPTEANAHPHGLTHSQVVHNGIIENYVSLKESVSTSFLSQTDTEVIVHLFEKHFAALGNAPDQALAAFRQTLSDLHGAFAILLISEHLPGKIFFVRQGSPLQVGFSDQGCFFASSDAPLLGHVEKTFYLEDGQWGMATVDTLALFDSAGEAVTPAYSALPASSLAAQKEGYRYFMEKEI